MKSIVPTPDFVQTTMEAVKLAEEKKRHSAVRKLAVTGARIGIPLGACLFGFVNLFRFILAAFVPAISF
jgi:hypothetical protein